AAQACLVPCDGRGHAQPAVGIGVVASEMALEQLCRRINRLGVELAAAVERDGLWTLGVQNVGKDFSDVAQGGVPIGGPKIARSAQAQERFLEAIRRVNGGTELRPFGADAAAVGGCRLDAPDAHNTPRRPLDPETAADTAVRTNTFPQVGQQGTSAKAAGA